MIYGTPSMFGPGYGLNEDKTMRNIERLIKKKKYNLLELTVYDQDDVRELSKHKDEKAD